MVIVFPGWLRMHYCTNLQLSWKGCTQIDQAVGVCESSWKGKKVRWCRFPCKFPMRSSEHAWWVVVKHKLYFMRRNCIHMLLKVFQEMQTRGVVHPTIEGSSRSYWPIPHKVVPVTRRLPAHMIVRSFSSRINSETYLWSLGNASRDQSHGSFSALPFYGNIEDRVK